MNLNQQIPEISAEMLLNFLYPDLEGKWIAHHDGTFYRNYSRDVLSVDPDEAQVWLSRDSLLRLLPQGLLSAESELKTGDPDEKHDEIEYKRQRAEESVCDELEKEIDEVWKTCNPIDEGMGVETANIHIEQFDYLAHHFAKWGAEHTNK